MSQTRVLGGFTIERVEQALAIIYMRQQEPYVHRRNLIQQ